MTAIPRPVSMVRGKMRSGSLVSSTMLTESSKPTIAKKAIDVAVVTATPVPGTASIQPLSSSPAKKLRASTLEDVDALVIPEQITAKATRKVMKCTQKALWE